RTDPRDALEVDHRWRLGAVELLVVDELLKQRSATPAVFFWPVDAHPASAVELAMPVATPLEFALVVGIELVVTAPIARKILLEPGPEFVTELFVLFAVFEIHREAPSMGVAPMLAQSLRALQTNRAGSQPLRDANYLQVGAGRSQGALFMKIGIMMAA